MTFAAVLAAVYAVLTLTLPVPQYGPVQIRFAEALCVLPFFFPMATPGLFIGCVLANLASPYVLDVVFGSAATLLACLWTGRIRSRWLAPLPAVICNAVIVGTEIAFSEVGSGPAFWPAFGFNALMIGAGELIACGLLGQLVLGAIWRTPLLRGWIGPERLTQLRGF
ncbi:MAG: QueT transporter family protein [Oscillospiraceae bacterium]|nr:QueT transporter family protein [Oscillospiraceae bacterium]